MIDDTGLVVRLEKSVLDALKSLNGKAGNMFITKEREEDDIESIKVKVMQRNRVSRCIQSVLYDYFNKVPNSEGFRLESKASSSA